MPYSTPGAPSWPPVRHPHQVYLMVSCALAGTIGLVIQTGAPSVQHTIDPVMYAIWNATLVAAGVLGLLAAWFARRDGVLSLLLERICHTIVGPASLLYGILVAVNQGPRSAFAVFMTVGFGLACLERLRECWVTIKWLHEQADDREAKAEVVRLVKEA